MIILETGQIVIIFQIAHQNNFNGVREDCGNTVLDWKGECIGNDCCARKLLASQSDFAGEKIWVQTV